MKRKKYGILFLTLLPGWAYAQNHWSVQSPDKKIKLDFSIQNLAPHPFGGNSPDHATYAVSYLDREVIRPSRLGLVVGGKAELSSCFRVKGHQLHSHTGSWKPSYGEQSQYPDNFNELSIHLTEYVAPYRDLVIHFRAYNEGIAVRYSFPSIKKQEVLNIVNELTEFNLPDSSWVWAEYGALSQGLYQKVQLTQLKPNCELPLLAQTESGFVCIAETANDNYPRSYIAPNPRKGSTIQLRGEANLTSGQTTPWRVVMIGKTAGELLEHNYLLMNLNEPSIMGDWSWIKPGRIIRDVTLSTQGSKAYIDYAAYRGLSGIILDWGWYGKPFSDAADARRVNVVYPMTGEPFKDHTGLALPEVLAYAKSKKIDVWLYVNYQALERQLDELLPLYQSWGIVGIKPGFVRVASQEWEKWTHHLVRKAAQYKLMVDIHDSYRPSGFSRTYPNLLTQEGIRGNEANPDATQHTMQPFTRFVIGAADYTPCYCKPGMTTSFAHRLAMPIITYSPLQSFFWGEKLNEDCHYAPELALWTAIPTVWDETKVVAGEPGEYIIMARRKDKTWYLGAITNNNARVIQIPLAFLGAGQRATAQVYTDGGDDITSYTKVITESRPTASNDVWTFSLKPSGGMAAKIEM